jgi:hypothetical protein
VLRTALLLTCFALAAGLAACGGSSDSGAEELARQHELAAAKRQAAQDARQGARIKGLERELARAGHSTAGEASGSADTQGETTAEAPSLGDWPGGSAYTAILASLGSEEVARTEQAQASGRGLDAGVLFSTEFSSLRPGYWVVFSGTFSGEDAAAGRAARARELGYVDAYPRFVSP